jgi:hypothetical protein
VEAGKKAATAVLSLQLRVRQVLAEGGKTPRTADEIAGLLQGADPEAVYHILQHLAANHQNIRVSTSATAGADAFAIS